MTAALLGYPQIVLAVWGPLVLVTGWWLLRPLTRRLPARERFLVAWCVAVTPVVAIFVPYLPDSPVRTAVPWRAPLAWGVTNGACVSSDGCTVPPVVIMVFGALTFVQLASVAASFLLGGVEVLRARRRIAALPKRRDGDVLVLDAPPPGFVACVVGMLRPRILVDAAVHASPHADAVEGHERAHAAARHPLWIFIAVCASRALWWIPGRRAVLAELRLTAELQADQHVRDHLGVAALAHALRANLATDGQHRPGSAVLGAGFAAESADPHAELAHRVAALAAPARTTSRATTWAIRAATVCGVLTAITLF